MSKASAYSGNSSSSTVSLSDETERKQQQDRTASRVDKIRPFPGTLQENSEGQNVQPAFDFVQNVMQSLQELRKHRDDSPGSFEETAELHGVNHDEKSLPSRVKTGPDSGKDPSCIQNSHGEVSGKTDDSSGLKMENPIEALEKKLMIIREEVLTSNMQGFSEIEDQLQTLSSIIHSLTSNDTLNATNPSNKTFLKYFEYFDRRMDEIMRGILVSATNSNFSSIKEEFDRIKTCVASLARSVEDFPAETCRNSMAPVLTDLINVPEQMESALSRLEKQIARLSLLADSDRNAIKKEFGCQLASIARQIDQLQQASGREGISESANAVIIRKLDSLSFAISQATDNNNNLHKQMQSQIAELSSCVGQVLEILTGKPESSFVDDSLLARELQALIPHIESLASGQSRAACHEQQLSNLKDRIAGISSQLQFIVGQVANLKAIEEYFSMNRERLTQFSDELKSHNAKNFGFLTEFLSGISNRFNDIERHITNKKSASGAVLSDEDETRPHNNEINAASGSGNSTRQTDSTQFEKSDTGGASGSISDVFVTSLLASSTSPDQSTFSPEKAQKNMANDGFVLKSGSSTPDIDKNSSLQINLTPREKQNVRGENIRNEKKKGSTDFIAAAREAAQNAERDLKVTHNRHSEKKSGFSFKRFFSYDKKSATLGIAVVVLGTFFLPGIRNFYSSQVQQVKVTEQTGPDVHMPFPEHSFPEKMVPDGYSGLSSIKVANLKDTSKLMSSSSGESPNNTFFKHEVSGNIDRKPLFSKGTPSSVMNETGGKAGPEIISMLPEIIAPFALRQAALDNNPQALLEIGRRYAAGVIGKPDFNEAVKWYRLSASFNYAPAQRQLGLTYEKGYGVTSDMKKAAAWYSRAASQGNALAMHNMAIINAMGLLEGGVNMKNALFWFNRAAEHGVRDSQVNLGIIYAKGIGVKKNLKESYKWLAIAAKSNDRDAIQKRDTVAKRMSLDQLKKVNEKIRLWQAKELNAQVNLLDTPEEWGAV